MSQVNAANAKADIDPILQQQLTTIQQQAAATATAMPQGNQCLWMMPNLNKWDGDMFNWQDMEKPFDRSASNQAATKAISDATNSGTTGDLVVTQSQTDYLAVMERSFRSRHTMSRVRAMAQAIGRKYGHGQGSGPLTRCVLDYIQSLVLRSKGGN